MPIFPAGSINTTALTIPDLYVQVAAPGTFLLNGVPTNVGGFVGTAVWGPVGVPVLVSGTADYAKAFGGVQNRKYDMGTHVSRAVLEGQAAVYACVRVTDGTDVAATATVQTNCITLTSKYTGTGGNGIKLTLATGSAVGSFKAVVSLPFRGVETFDNISGTGNAFWVNLASAINNGNGPSTPASQIIVASAGVGVTAPTLATTSLATGTDGATTITGAVLVGVDTTPRKGMYALRSYGVSVAALCDADDSTTYAGQISFGLGEGVYMMLVGPAGDTIANAVSTRNSGGIDTYTAKLILGDWELWYDAANGINRYISPQAAAVGKLCNLAPQQSSLNKQLTGTIGTQRSASGAPYSSAELQLIAGNGLEVIANPIPAGNQFGFRMGRNASSNAVIHGDNYTRMTNYIAATLSAGMGKYVGKLQSRQPSDPTRAQAAATLNAFLQSMQQQGMIDDFQVVLDRTNNPDNRIALGYMQADVKVVYLAVVEYFLVNLEGGQSVQIIRTNTTPSSLATN
jgi:phage tail sheath protein FI